MESHTLILVPFFRGLKEHGAFSSPAHVLTFRDDAVTVPLHFSVLFSPPEEDPEELPADPLDVDPEEDPAPSYFGQM